MIKMTIVLALDERSASVATGPIRRRIFVMGHSTFASNSPLSAGRPTCPFSFRLLELLTYGEPMRGYANLRGHVEKGCCGVPEMRWTYVPSIYESEARAS